MPRLSVWTIRASFVYLILGFTLGALLLLAKGGLVPPVVWRLLPLHIECLVFGWMVQLAMGVIFWIFPRFRFEPRRGNVPAAWTAFVLLNLGVWLAGAGPVVGAPAVVPLLGRLAEAGAAAAFAVHAWPRVRPVQICEPPARK